MNDFIFKANELMEKYGPRENISFKNGRLLDNKMCMVVNKTKRLPNKYIKKLFKRPDKAYCKECNSSMTRLIEDGRPNAVIFACDGDKNPNCSNIIDLSSYSDKFEGGRYYFNVKRAERPRKSHNVVPKEKKPDIFIMRRFRLKDKFYIINDDLTYNPVRKIYVERNIEFTPNEEMHNEYLEKVRASLQKDLIVN